MAEMSGDPPKDFIVTSKQKEQALLYFSWPRLRLTRMATYSCRLDQPDCPSMNLTSFCQRVPWTA